MTACPHCGEPISEKEKNCPVCGTAIESDAAAPNAKNLSEGTDREKEAAAEETAPEEISPDESVPEETSAEDPAREEKSSPPEASVPEETAPAEASASLGEPVSPEEVSPKERASLLARLRKMRQEQKPAFLFNAEVRGKVLRRIGYICTAFGLLALLTVAVVLIFLQRQQRNAGNDQVHMTSALPARQTVINYYRQTDPDRVVTEAQVRYLPDELIVVAAQGVSYTDMERFFGQQGIRVLGYVELTETYQLGLPGKHSLYGLSRIIEKLEMEEQVACAAVNVVWKPAGCSVPDDPWDGSTEWEETVPGASNWGLAAIRAPESWERFESGTVRLGLVDSDFDPKHEDLRYGLLRANEGFTRARSTEKAFWQHGTAVAAVAGAIHGNGLGLSGAAEDCLIYAVGSGSLCGQMDALSALAELAVQDVQVAELGLSWEEELLEAILQEDSQARRYYWSEPARLAQESLKRLLEKEYDFLLVQPAGNGLQGQGTEARYVSPFAGADAEEIRRRILVVGAAGLNGEGQLYEAPFSGRGQRVDLLAPGVDVYTALPQGNYARLSGSSLAAAYAAALGAEAWALNPALSGGELRELLVSTAQAVPGGSAGLLDMTAALEMAARSAEALPGRTEEELAMDEYAALLHRGAQLRLGVTGDENRVAARDYLLLDMDGDGVDELLLYALDERNLTASFALYGYRNGELSLLADSWESCRFSSWSNSQLTLEIWDGRCLFAQARRSSAVYAGSGECFWITFDGEAVSISQEDPRDSAGSCLALIENSAITEEGIRIGSARDLLWER